jgi:hypothetical protein
MTHATQAFGPNCKIKHTFERQLTSPRMWADVEDAAPGDDGVGWVDEGDDGWVDEMGGLQRERAPCDLNLTERPIAVHAVTLVCPCMQSAA